MPAAGPAEKLAWVDGLNRIDRADRFDRFWPPSRTRRSRLGCSGQSDKLQPPRFRSGQTVAFAGGQFCGRFLPQQRCPCSSASRIVAQICLQRLPCSSKWGQSHQTASLPFDHFSETLYSSDPCTSAPTWEDEPTRIFTRFPAKYLSPRSLEEALRIASPGSKGAEFAGRRLIDSLPHSSKPPVWSRQSVK